MFNFWEAPEDTPPPPARSAIFVMRNGRYEPQNLMPMLPRPDTLDFDGFVARRGANAGYMNPRPPEMRQATLMRNPVSIRRDSARCLRSNGDPMRRPSGESNAPVQARVEDDGKLRFSVTFDALRSGSVSVFLLVTEKERTVQAAVSPPSPSSNENAPGATPSATGSSPASTERILELRSRVGASSCSPSAGGEEEEPVPPTPLDVKHFQEGMSQVYVSPPIDISKLTEDMLTYNPDHPKDIPLAVRMDAEEVPGEERCSQYTYLSFHVVPESPSPPGRARRPMQWSVSVIGQKLQYGKQCFVCHEVFGVSSKQMAEVDAEGNNNDCVICLSEPRDTAVLPCRHMCFCGYCAGIVRLQCDRCPVCRQKVASLLQFRREKDKSEDVPESLAPAASSAATEASAVPAAAAVSVH